MLYDLSLLVFFFFKQKTAYEMRISDWSSDVCSSDLQRCRDHRAARPGRIEPALRDQILIGEDDGLAVDAEYPGELAAAGKIGARGEPSALDIPDQRLDDLHIDRNIARGVDPLAETDLPWPQHWTSPDEYLTCFPGQSYRDRFRTATGTGQIGRAHV